MRVVAILKAGQMFGEKGLDEGIKRTATVVCQQPCYFGVFLKEDYDEILKEASKAYTELKKRFFHFKVFSKSVESEISSELSFQFFKQRIDAPRGKVIFKKGDKPDFVYVLYEGEILVCDDHIEELLGRATDHELFAVRKARIKDKICLLGPGEIFGDMYLLDDKKQENRQMHAISVSDCTLLRVKADYFDEYLNKHYAVRKFVKEKVKQKYSFRKRLQRGIRRKRVMEKRSKKKDRVCNSLAEFYQLFGRENSAYGRGGLNTINVDLEGCGEVNEGDKARNGGAGARKPLKEAEFGQNGIRDFGDILTDLRNFDQGKLEDGYAELSLRYLQPLQIRLNRVSDRKMRQCEFEETYCKTTQNDQNGPKTGPNGQKSGPNGVEDNLLTEQEIGYLNIRGPTKRQLLKEYSESMRKQALSGSHRSQNAAMTPQNAKKGENGQNLEKFHFGHYMDRIRYPKKIGGNTKKSSHDLILKRFDNSHTTTLYTKIAKKEKSKNWAKSTHKRDSFGPGRQRGTSGGLSKPVNLKYRMIHSTNKKFLRNTESDYYHHISSIPGAWGGKKGHNRRSGWPKRLGMNKNLTENLSTNLTKSKSVLDDFGLEGLDDGPRGDAMGLLTISNLNQAIRNARKSKIRKRAQTADIFKNGALRRRRQSRGNRSLGRPQSRFETTRNSHREAFTGSLPENEKMSKSWHKAEKKHDFEFLEVGTERSGGYLAHPVGPGLKKWPRERQGKKKRQLLRSRHNMFRFMSGKGGGRARSVASSYC